MRKHLGFGIAAVALFLLPARGFAYQQNQSQQNQQQSSAQAPPPAQPAAQTPQATPAQKDSLVAAAHRSRDEKKDQSKPAKVFTNDDLPAAGGISSVGEAAAPGENGTGDGKAPAADASSPNDEKTWRARFATLRHKLEQDQQELDVMQRELGVLDVQYYGNPVKAMQQDLTREDINKKTGDIDAKKQQIVADQQAISDLEDDLRKAGGDSGWAR